MDDFNRKDISFYHYTEIKHQKIIIALLLQVRLYGLLWLFQTDK